MYCKNCGKQNSLDSKFCVGCGNQVEQQTIKNQNPINNNFDSKKKKKSTIKIIVGIIAGFFIVGIGGLALIGFIISSIFSSAIGNNNNKKNTQEMHSKEELIYALDNLDCSKNNNSKDTYYGKSTQENTTNDRLLNCNIKNNYTILREEIELSERDTYYNVEPAEMRVIYVQLKNYDVEFSIKSSIQCTRDFSASCTKREYVITTDYQIKTTEYFIKKYSEQKNVTLNNKDSSEGYFSPFYTVNNKNEITNATVFVNDFVKYINDLNIRFLPLTYKQYTLEISFPSKIHPNGGWYSVYLKLVLNDGKYILKGNEDYQNYGDLIIINDLSEYLLKYAQANGIF